MEFNNKMVFFVDSIQDNFEMGVGVCDNSTFNTFLFFFLSLPFIL